MTVLASVPQWPQGDQGKVLLHLLVNGSVDSLFDDLFGSYPELQAKLHRQRNDTNCAETPWVPQRADLPGQQFMWPAPPAGADPGTPGQSKCRKVRFEAAASMASKAFNSEEVQIIHAYSPGSHYLVQAEVSTTAMYGDQFCIISRTSLVARGPDKTQLHIVYAIDFKPTIGFLLKPMVAKGVDGGIRGTFSLLKKLLQEQYTLRDLPETAQGPEMPGEAAAVAAAVPAVLTTVPVPQPVPAGAAAAASPLLFQLADYIVYQELVAGLLKISDPSVIAKGLAMCLTLAMIHVMIVLLRPILQACSAASSSGGFGGLLCWPLVGVLDLPDNITEVLSALLLVAAANRLLMLGTEVASTWMRPPAASRAFSGLPTDISLPNGELPAPAEAAAAAVAGASEGMAVSRASSSASVRWRTASGQLSPSPAAAGASSSPAASPLPASGTTGAPLDNVFNNLGHVMSGWGRNLLGGSALDSIFTGASWSRPSSATALAAESESGAGADNCGQGSGAGAPDGLTSPTSSTAGSSSTTPARALGHRHTTSFTATMDPSGLNIIEDYAPEPQQQQLPQLAEEQQQQNQHQKRPGTPSSAPARAAKQAVKNSSAAEAAAESASARPASPSQPAGASAAGACGGGSGASSAASSGSASPTKAGDKNATHSTSRLAAVQSAASSSAAAAVAAAPAAAGQQPAVKPQKSVAREVLAADADGEGISRQGSLRQPLLAAASQSSMDGSVDGAGSFSKQGEARPADAGSATPTPSTAASARSPARAKSVAFSANTNSKERSPSRLDKVAGSFSVGSTGSTGSHDRSLARRSASPALWGNDSREAAAAAAPGSRPISSTSMRSDGLGDGLGYEALSGGPSYVVPGEEEDDEVLVEVFEHERKQPFRGWGHTWPGHFLPSDRVGHWGDRSGAPGGAMSMLFDRVAPKLPVGWAWKDDEWEVDMTGAEHEGCDADGWSYGMDFSWLTWPPGPQTGKPVLQSFVRRRRWVRTRERLPLGSYDVQSPELQQQLAAFQQQQQEMGRSSGGGSGASEGGLMAGLGAGAGLFSQDSKAAAQAAAAQAAAAASQAASAMMNRFMRAVADLPMQGSGGGSVPTSPPASALAASPGRANSSTSAQARSAPVTARAGAAASQQAVSRPTGSGAEAATAVTPSTEQAEGVAAAADRSVVDEGDSSSSSSVDSGTPPPRPKLPPTASEDLGEGQSPLTGSPVRQLQHQLEQETASSTAPAASAVVSGTLSRQQQQQPSPAQEAPAAAAVQERLHDNAAAASAPSASTAEAELAADAEPLAGLRPSTITSSGDWEWSAARVGSPTAAAAGGSSSSSKHAANNEAAVPSAQTTSDAGAIAAHTGSAGPAAAPAAPVGTPISTLRKAGSGFSGTGSPHVGSAGRGAVRGSRSSSGGGSRSGKGKLGAVSLRHSAEAALRSSSGASWGSGVLLSPAASQALEISPTTSLAAGGTSAISSVDSSTAAESGDVSSLTTTAAAANMPSSSTPTSSSGNTASSSTSSRVAATSAASTATCNSSDAPPAVAMDPAGMCEGMSGSLSPLRAAAGTADAAGGSAVLTAPKQDALRPVADEAGTLAAAGPVEQGVTDVRAASAAGETAGLADVGSNSLNAAKAPVAVEAPGAATTVAEAGAAGLSKSAQLVAGQFEPATAAPGPGKTAVGTSAGHGDLLPALQSEGATAASPLGTKCAQPAAGGEPATSSTVTGQELGAGLDAAYSTATGTSAASSAADADADAASTAMQGAGTADTASIDEPSQASSTGDVASGVVGSGGCDAAGAAVGGAAEDAAAGHISTNYTIASSAHGSSDVATGVTAGGVQTSGHGSLANGMSIENDSGVAAAEASEAALAADVPQEGTSASGEWTAW